MKIPRYIYGRSNVGELSNQGLVSPATAARTQLAKSGAISSALGAASDIAMAFQQRKDKQIEADDNRRMHEIEINAKVESKRFINDPRWKKAKQEDGTPTPEAMRKEAEKLRQNLLAMTSDIQDPKRRESFATGLQGVMDLNQVDWELAIEERHIEIGQQSGFDAMEAAIEVGDFSGARSLIAQMAEDGYLWGEDHDKAMEFIDKAEIGHAAGEIVAQVDNAYSVSEKAGDEAYRELLGNKELPQAVREKAIDGAEEKRTEWGKAYEREAQEAEAEALYQYGNDHVRAGVGDMSFREIEASFRSGKYGDAKDPSAVRRRNGLIDAAVSAAKRKDTEIDVRQALEAGQFIPDEKAYRDALDSYIGVTIEGREPAEQLQIIGDVSRTAGTVSTSVMRTLGTAGVAKQAAIDNIALYRELTKDPDRVPNLHLTSDAEHQLQHMTTLMDAGMSAEESAELAWDSRPSSMTEAQKIVREDQWKEIAGAERQGKGAFDRLIDSDWYEEPGFGDVDKPLPPQMQAEYNGVMKSAFMATGNQETAQAIADRTIKRQWVMSNLNSDDPKEYAIIKGGVPGDASILRKQIIGEIEAGSGYKAQQPDGTWKGGALESKRITFEPEGDRLRVLYDGMPLARVTDDGIEVAEAEIDPKLLEAQKHSAKQQEQASKRLREIEREERRLNRMVEQKTPSIRFSGGKAFARERLKVLKQEREALESKAIEPVNF